MSAASAAVKFAAVVVVPLLGVVGISHAVPDDEPMTEFPGKPEPVIPTMSADDARIAEKDLRYEVNHNGFYFGAFEEMPRDRMVEIGYDICEAYDGGQTQDQVVAWLEPMTSESPIPYFPALTMSEVSVLYLCPHHESKLEVRR